MNGQVIKHSTGGFKLLMIAVTIILWVIRARPIYLGAVVGLLVAQLMRVLVPSAALPDAVLMFVGACVGIVIFVRNDRRERQRDARMKEIALRIDEVVSRMSDDEVLQQIEQIAQTNEHLRLVPSKGDASFPAELPASTQAFFTRFESAEVYAVADKYPTRGFFFSRADIARQESGAWRVGLINRKLPIFVDASTGHVAFHCDQQGAHVVVETDGAPAPAFISLPRFVLVFALNYEGARSLDHETVPKTSR